MLEMNTKKPLIIVSVICLLAVTAMIIALVSGGRDQTNSFVPPSFDNTAENGTPSVDEDLGYSEIYQDGMDFKAWICGNVKVNNSSAVVYFTNDPENDVWMKLRILDQSGNTLGETGLIKPGEYVESVKLETVPENGSDIKLKIMAYEPDTYYSAGSVSLNTTITVGD